MNADEITRVVADLREGRVQLLEPTRVRHLTADGRSELAPFVVERVVDPVVVDCTAIYHDVLGVDRVHVYEDHPCVAPPFDESAFCYVNDHRNVVVLHATVFDDLTHYSTWTPSSENAFAWSDVRWVIEVVVFVGDASRTVGPTHMWLLAVGDTGQLVDVRWVQVLEEYDMSNWDVSLVVVLGALNLLNCVNVEAVEPTRDRATRRRLARAGVQVREIVVRSRTRRSPRGDAQNTSEVETLRSVRGHFAHYGDCCPGIHPPRGRLFGRLEGRYWVPQHGRTNRRYRIAT